MADKQILDPYWGNEEKTQILCDFLYPDSTQVSVAISNPDGDNPDWDEVFTVYKESDLDDRTELLQAGKLEDKNKFLLQRADEMEKAKNEALFQAKIDAFQIEEVKASKDRTLKAKVRKATNLAEVFAYTSVIILKSSETKPAPKKTKAKAKKK